MANTPNTIVLPTISRSCSPRVSPIPSPCCGVLSTFVERDAVYRGRDEPQLGRRGLFAAMGGQRAASYGQMALLWVLNLADGRHSLLDIADRAAVPFATVRAVADALVAAELLEPISA